MRQVSDVEQLEGLFTIVAGVIFITLFPKNTGNPVATLGFRYFNERDTYILSQRVLIDDPTKVHVRPHVSWEEVKRTVSCPRYLGLSFDAADHL